MPAISRRDALVRLATFLAPSALLGGAALALPSCESGGNFTLFGYTTKPNYRCDVKSVRVPIFKSLIQLDATRRGLEMDLTRAVVKQIEWVTPMKVKDDADTELTGTITSLTKGILNYNQQNLPRETQTTMVVMVQWQDLRTGKYLTRPARGPGALPTPPPEVPPGTAEPPPPPVAVYSLGQLVPEIGQSNASAYQQNLNGIAVQIVSMMEEGW